MALRVDHDAMFGRTRLKVRQRGTAFQRPRHRHIQIVHSQILVHRRTLFPRYRRPCRRLVVRVVSLSPGGCGRAKGRDRTIAGRDRRPANSRQGHHLLNGLPRHSQFSGDIRLGEASVEKGLHQVATLDRKLSSQSRVLNGLRPHLFDSPKCLCVVFVCCHDRSMTTPSCQCQPLVVTPPRGLTRFCGEPQ